ncbi:hypothetical protein PIB30_069705 [Stylosanthes scabra]|uniref:Uncharacterized protein n=1 Tax=Stylosanthes scabra TaxID=79078 RepID=A0ABU6SND0_9FABA|nr:hypothetical protein [Stylosanthes scabra]
MGANFMSRFRNSRGKELLTNAAYSASLKGVEHYMQCLEAHSVDKKVSAGCTPARESMVDIQENIKGMQPLISNVVRLVAMHKAWTVNRAKFGAKVAKESATNEKIAKKSLKAKSKAYAYAPKEPMRTHCHALGIMS